MKKTIIASAILSMLSFGALADNPSFDNVEIGYTEFDFDGFDIDGFEVKASKSINDDFYVAGDYTTLSENGFDLKLTTVDSSDHCNTLLNHVGWRFKFQCFSGAFI